MRKQPASERHYFSGVIRDITQRKLAERDILFANRALDEKNQKLEALSAKLAKYLPKQVYNSIFTGRMRLVLFLLTVVTVLGLELAAHAGE